MGSSKGESVRYHWADVVAVQSPRRVVRRSDHPRWFGPQHVSHIDFRSSVEVTDANVLSMPPKATIQQAEGFALAMTKMAFTGELNDVMDTVAANWRYL